MRYEAVVISDDDETDYSSAEDDAGAVGRPMSLSPQVGVV